MHKRAPLDTRTRASVQAQASAFRHTNACQCTGTSERLWTQERVPVYRHKRAPLDTRTSASVQAQASAFRHKNECQCTGTSERL
ncbi:hypothetical protein NDU88_001351 [Pleurodeles waltl]|uniref:Uncharacterized protein n=1 Tax=Pleurodeles waltl TaxID=8319 RepID=A0AAV7R6T7_PLEWA|nr:hypothetical protein NDU88_001351 [Pleurodeles waltl]